MERLNITDGVTPVNKAIMDELQNNVENAINLKGDKPEIVSNNYGTAIKYPSGTMIVYQKFYKYINTPSVKVGELYSQDIPTIQDYPVPFIDNPVLNITWTSGYYTGFICPKGKEAQGENTINCGEWKILSPTSNPKFEGYVNIIAIGKWK